MRRVALALLALAGPAVLAGCTSTGKDFGFGRTVPNEFAALSQPPLTLPPGYQLRPPRPGAPPRTTASPRERAYRMLYEEARSAASFSRRFARKPQLSRGQVALLRRTGGNRVHPHIRDIVRVENTGRAVLAPKLLDQVQAYSDGQPEQGPVRLYESDPLPEFP